MFTAVAAATPLLRMGCRENVVACRRSRRKASSLITRAAGGDGDSAGSRDDEDKEDDLPPPIKLSADQVSERVRCGRSRVTFSPSSGAEPLRLRPDFVPCPLPNPSLKLLKDCSENEKAIKKHRKITFVAKYMFVLLCAGEDSVARV